MTWASDDPPVKWVQSRERVGVKQAGEAEGGWATLDSWYASPASESQRRTAWWAHLPVFLEKEEVQIVL